MTVDDHRSAVTHENRVGFRLGHDSRHQRVIRGNQDNGMLFALRTREIENRLHLASAVSRNRKTCRKAAMDLGAFRIAMKPLSEDGDVELKMSGSDHVRARHSHFTPKRRTAQIESVSAMIVAPTIPSPLSSRARGSRAWIQLPRSPQSDAARGTLRPDSCQSRWNDLNPIR